MTTISEFFGEGDVLSDPRTLARQGRSAAGPTSSAAVSSGSTASTHVDPAASSVEGSGVFWEPQAYSPSWLGAIFNPFGSHGHWETAPGSFADQFIRKTPEYKNAHKACMLYLKSHENYAGNAALHRECGTLDEYHRTLEDSAHDYAQRVCINDYWHMGDNVGSPQYTADDPLPPGYVPMRQRIEQAYAGRQARQGAQPAAGAVATYGATAEAAPAAAEQSAAASPDAGIRRLLVDEGHGDIGIGTAWCVAPGKFVTCRHVVEGGHALSLDEDGHSLNASSVGVSSSTDAAMVDCPGSNATPLPIGPDPQPGDYVTMVGFPYGEYQEFHGRVVEIGPLDESPTDFPQLPEGAAVVKIEGDGAPGESGGPCFVNGHVAGHVVGGDPSRGLVYVVPTSEIGTTPSARRGAHHAAAQASGGSAARTGGPLTQGGGTADAETPEAYEVEGYNGYRSGGVSSIGVGVGVGDGCYYPGMYPGFYPGLGYPMGSGIGVGVGVGETFGIPFSATLSPSEIGCAEASSVNGETGYCSYASPDGDHAVQWADADTTPTPLVDHRAEMDTTPETDASAEPETRPELRHEADHDYGLAACF